MSKKDKLLEQLKSGKLTQSGGATINLTDSLNTNVTFSATSTPVGTFSNVQSILNAIQHSQYSANTAGANIASLSANIKNDIFGNNYFNNMETYGAGNSNTFLTSASLFNNDSNIGGLPLYIADQITAGMSSVPGVAGPAGPAGPKGDAGAAGVFDPTTLTGDMVIGAINNFYRGITGATGATGATGTSCGAMYGGSFNSSNFNQLNLDETGTLGSFNYPNRLLTLYDFIGDGAGNFNTTAQDLAAALNTLPLAQFKHLPSKNALALTSGGGKKQNRRRTSDKLVLKRK